MDRNRWSSSIGNAGRHSARKVEGQREGQRPAGIQLSLVSGLSAAIAKRFWPRATVPKDKPIEVAASGAFERSHLVPSGNRRDPYDDPFDIASNAVELGIHGARFLSLYFKGQLFNA